MTKKHKQSGSLSNNPSKLTVEAVPKEDVAAAFARTAIRPTVQAAATIREYQPLDKEVVTVDALVQELGDVCKAANDGDLRRGEAMLAAQAHTLDAIFGECARRARNNMGTYPQTAEQYLRVGLRAQSQCRATWETLAQMKNPAPVAFVRQANIANGPQQVNNGSVPEPSRARESETAPTKLIEAENGLLRPNPGTSAPTGRADPQVATVGEIDRTKDAGG